MIHLDASDGLSADMVLAAMIGLLDPEDREDVLERLRKASAMLGVTLHSAELEEDGDSGLALSYVSRGSSPPTVGYDDAFSNLSSICDALGGGHEVARKILGRIFEAESAAHGEPPERVHLHEIGRAQAMLNIAGIGLLAPMVVPEGEAVAYSAIATGRGVTATSHGTLRIPPPATAFLLRGLAHWPGDHPGERATPTGVAALSVLSTEHSDEPPKNPVVRSVGFGTKRFAGRRGRVVITRS